MRTTFLILNHDLLQMEQWNAVEMTNKIHLRIKMDPRSDELVEPWHLLPLLSGMLLSYGQSELVVWDSKKTKSRLSTLRGYAKGAMEKIRPLTDFAKTVTDKWNWETRDMTQMRWIDMKEVYETVHDVKDAKLGMYGVEGSSVVRLRKMFHDSDYQKVINAMRGV